MFQHFSLKMEKERLYYLNKTNQDSYPKPDFKYI